MSFEQETLQLAHPILLSHGHLSAGARTFVVPVLSWMVVAMRAQRKGTRGRAYSVEQQLELAARRATDLSAPSFHSPAHGQGIDRLSAPIVPAVAWLLTHQLA